MKLVGALGILVLMLSLLAAVGDSSLDPQLAGEGLERGTHSQAAPEDKAKRLPDEAPTGFNNSTNGVEPQDAFDRDRQKFEEIEAISDGLGPVYNATSCVSCHQNPVSGSSKIGRASCRERV